MNKTWEHSVILLPPHYNLGLQWWNFLCACEVLYWRCMRQGILCSDSNTEHNMKYLFTLLFFFSGKTSTVLLSNTGESGCSWFVLTFEDIKISDSSCFYWYKGLNGSTSNLYTTMVTESKRCKRKQFFSVSFQFFTWNIKG
jgi:hypothetical protein